MPAVASLAPAALLAASAVAAPDWSRPRSLPSPVVRWSRELGACAIAARERVVFVLSRDRVVALEAATGKERWRAQLRAVESCPYWWQDPLQIQGDALAAILGQRAYLIDPANGRIRQAIALGAPATGLAGPPLSVATIKRAGAYTLLSVDETSGRVLAKHDFASISALAPAGEVVMAGVSEHEKYYVLGLRHGDLEELWRLPGFRLDPALRVVYAEGAGADKAFTPIDPATGRLGMPLAPRRSVVTSAGRHRTSWELAAALPQDPWPKLARYVPETGKPLWSAKLPGGVAAVLRNGEDVLAACDAGTGRLYLLRLDWTTGALRSFSYGAPSLYQMLPVGEDVVLQSETTVAVVAGRETGAPEAVLHPAAAEVRRILARKVEHWNVAEPLAELKTLGPEALPVLVEAVPGLDATWLSAVAGLLGEAAHRAAAAPLLRRLRDPKPLGDSAQAAVLAALSDAGGAAEVSGIAELLFDAQRSASVRRQALAALASIGTPEAAAAIEKLLATPQPPRSWWDPPSPEAFLALIGKPVDEKARKAASAREQYAEWARLGRGATAARLSLPNGRALVLFKDARLGSRRDFWAAELDASGRSAPARFLGPVLPGADCDDECRIGATLDGSVLEIRRTDAAASPVRVDWPLVARDSDGDGLTDLVEKRLGTDASRPDSDADGVPDGQDACPNARRAALAEEQAIAAAVFRQFFMFDEDQSLAAVVNDVVQEWPGRAGPTLAVTPAGQRGFEASSGVSGVTYITLVPTDEARPAGQLAGFTRLGGVRPKARPGDRVFGLTLYRGPLDAVGYRLLVRKLGSRWVIRAVFQTFVA